MTKKRFVIFVAMYIRIVKYIFRQVNVVNLLWLWSKPFAYLAMTCLYQLVHTNYNQY